MIAKDLVEAIKCISASQSTTAEIMLKTITKILVAFSLTLFVVLACLSYCVHSIYNYESYPTIPNIENNAISGSNNTVGGEK